MCVCVRAHVCKGKVERGNLISQSFLAICCYYSSAQPSSFTREIDRKSVVVEQRDCSTIPIGPSSDLETWNLSSDLTS